MKLSRTGSPWSLVNLDPLMQRTAGSPEIRLGLIDGPLVAGHPDFAWDRIRTIPGVRNAARGNAINYSCIHGTFVAGILAARRDCSTPGICPGCTLLVRTIFSESPRPGPMPSATPEELAEAVVACIDEGAKAINISAALAWPSAKSEHELKSAFDYAARRGVIVIAAAGNQGAVGSTAITRHPWVIPVIGCDERGRPTDTSNLGGSIGRNGLSAPGVGVTGLGPEGRPLTLGGTSVAAPFVTGSVGLLWSEFPSATASQIRMALTRGTHNRRASIVPGMLDAWRTHQELSRAGRAATESIGSKADLVSLRSHHVPR